MADTLTTLLTTAGGAYLGKFVGPAAEAMGKAAWERAQQVGAKAIAYLAAVGREPQPVEPKLLLPLVQAASLETDPTLAELWAALLANAADPAQQVTVQPGFADVLRQLTPTDALVLEMVAQASQQTAPRLRTYIMAQTFALQQDITRLGGGDVNVAVDNVARLGLCRTHEAMEHPVELDKILSGGGSRKKMLALAGSLNREQITITHLGLAFLAAVTPPTP